MWAQMAVCLCVCDKLAAYPGCTMPFTIVNWDRLQMHATPCNPEWEL